MSLLRASREEIEECKATNVQAAKFAQVRPSCVQVWGSVQVSQNGLQERK